MTTETRFVCTCGGGCKSEANLTNHITNPNFWSIPGMNEMLGVPEKHHAPLGTVEGYATKQTLVEFKANQTAWRESIKAKRANGATSTAQAAAKGQCTAAKSDGTQCASKAKQGGVRCGRHPQAKYPLDFVGVVQAVQAPIADDTRMVAVETDVAEMKDSLAAILAAVQAK